MKRELADVMRKFTDVKLVLRFLYLCRHKKKYDDAQTAKFLAKELENEFFNRKG